VARELNLDQIQPKPLKDTLPLEYQRIAIELLRLLLVRDLPHDSGDKAIVQAIIQMGKALGPNYGR
jgi:EAL domain-containing protein (putative c-di-GMP-specific phosphodiesterase class I)